MKCQSQMKENLNNIMNIKAKCDDLISKQTKTISLTQIITDEIEKMYIVLRLQMY